MFLAPFLFTLVTYMFSENRAISFDVDVRFDGYLPVLGGHKATVAVAMTVEVEGLPVSKSGNLRSSSDIKALKLTYNGAEMPFGPASVKAFFPKTTIEYSPLGKLEKTDAPDVTLPVQLPGLDGKRFPDITYLPIEFPADGIIEGKTFKFSKQFGGSEVAYEVTPTKIDASSAYLAIKLNQKYTSFEDSHQNPTEESMAFTRVETTLVGEGTAQFDLQRRLVSQLDLQAVAHGHATELVSKLESDRNLKTSLKVRVSTK